MTVDFGVKSVLFTFFYMYISKWVHGNENENGNGHTRLRIEF